MAEYLGAAARLHGKPSGLALRIPVPALLARLGSHLCDLLHFSPFSYGHLELMRRDNLPQVNMLIRADRTARLRPVGVDLPDAARPAFAPGLSASSRIRELPLAAGSPSAGPWLQRRLRCPSRR